MILILILHFRKKQNKELTSLLLPNFLSDINMRPIQSLKYILLLGILALSLVAKPSFSESSNMEKNSGSKNANQVVGEIRQLLSKSLNKFKNGENENAAEILSLIHI